MQEISPAPELETPPPTDSEPRRPNYFLHLLLLLLAALSSAVVGSRLQYNFTHNLPIFGAGEGAASDAYPLRWVLAHPRELVHGIPFSLCVMAFFLAHELGHYFYCRRHHVDATLPYFLPFPTLIGTLGAVIRIRAPFRSRGILFDIGVAGPIAGMFVALPLVAVGLLLSKPLAPSAFDSDLLFGTPLAMKLLLDVLPVHITSMAQLQPHPVLIAGWVGLFATALNMLPSGQLDGGHILYAALPRQQLALSRITAALLLLLGFFCWVGWLLWGCILLLPIFRHPDVPVWPGLSRKQWLVLALAALIFALTFNPLPFHGQSGWQLLKEWRHAH